MRIARAKGRLQGLLCMCVLAPAAVAWGTPGDPIPGIDVKLGFDGGALVEQTTVSAVRGGAVSITSPRDVASGLPTGKRTYRPGRPVYGNLTLERAVGKSTAWREAGSGLATGRREAGSGLATGKRQHKPMVITLAQRDDQGSELRALTWFECFPTAYAVVEATEPGGRRIAVEQITFETGGLRLATRNKGGAAAGGLAVDLDGDGAPDLAATRQALAFDPNEGFAAGSSGDPSLSVTWTVDTTGPTVTLAASLNGIIGPEKPQPGKAGIIGPEINAVVSDGGKTVDEFPGMRVCGYQPPEFGEDVHAAGPPEKERLMLCGATDHL